MKKITQNYHLIALRAFLKFLRKRDIESLNPELSSCKVVAVIWISSRPITQSIMTAPPKQPASREAATRIDRLKTPDLELLFSTGPAVSELCSLNPNLDLTRDEFSVRGKATSTVVFLSQSAKKAVAEY